MATSPLSRSVRDLERDLGVRVFDRDSRNVRLTPAGRVLLPSATEIVALMDGLREELSTNAPTEMTVGVAQGVPPRVISQAEEGLAATLDGVKVSWYPGVAASLVNMVQRRALDAGIVPRGGWSGGPDERGIAHHTVVPKDRLGIVMRNDDELAKLPVIGEALLRKRSFVLPPRAVAPDAIGRAIDWLRSIGVRQISEVAESELIASHIRYGGQYGMARLDGDDPWSTVFNSCGLVTRRAVNGPYGRIDLVWLRARSDHDEMLVSALAAMKEAFPHDTDTSPVPRPTKL